MVDQAYLKNCSQTIALLTSQTAQCTEELNHHLKMVELATKQGAILSAALESAKKDLAFYLKENE